MKNIDYKNCFKIENLRDFDLGQTLECGQCFHYEKLDENEYGVVAYDKLLHIMQKEDELYFLNVSDPTDGLNWIKYFDLSRDYGLIKDTLIKKDEKLKEAIEDKGGVRILNQEFSETLMSFIISQNKQIPQIKKIVGDISKKYGKKLGRINGISFYSFPDIDALNKISEADYRKLKTGFRAPYLKDASEKMNEMIFVPPQVLTGHEVIDFKTKFNKREANDGFIKYRLKNMDYDNALNFLKEIKGVGDKVANCVLLFSLGYRSSFPIDVWIKRIMEDMYFEGKDTDKATIRKFAEEKYGEYAGYAQQYIFFHGRDNK